MKSITTFFLIGGIVVLTAGSCTKVRTTTEIPTTAMVEPTEQAAGEEALFRIQSDGKTGFIDNTGRVVVEPKYYAILDYSEGVAACEILSKYGYIDRTGQLVIQPRFPYGDNFFEGLAATRSGMYWGYIDKTGKAAIEMKFQEAGKFSEGCAPVRVKAKWGYIDKTGKMRN